MNFPRPQISPERKTVYYAGAVLTTIGLVLFLSTFVSVAFGATAFRFLPLQPVGGVICIIVGGMLQKLGRQGLAGSGLLLDPEKARKDLEPWNRMAGGMAEDTLSEIGVVRKLEDHLDREPATPAPPQIKIRCRNCQALNDETAKFCNQCGSGL